MPFQFNTSNFPIVSVVFNGKIKSDNEFNLFTYMWESLYNYNKPFTMIFDTTNMKIPHIKYSIKLSMFIKKLKRKNPQYLKQSVIIIKKRAIVNLLEFIFLIQPPVAPVHLTKTPLYVIDIACKLTDDITNEIDIINTIYPRKKKGLNTTQIKHKNV